MRSYAVEHCIGSFVGNLHKRIADETTPDAMDIRLEADILKRILDNISEMYIEQNRVGYPKISTNRSLDSF